MRATTLATGVWLLAAAPASAAGQRSERYEISASVGALRFDNDRMLDPYGFSLGLGLVFSNHVKLLISWSDYRGGATSAAVFCDGGWPDYGNCAEEPADLSSHARLFDFALVASPHIDSTWGADFGIGVGWGTMEAAGISRTSGRSDGAFPGGLMGMRLHMSVSRRFAGPLRAFVAARLLTGRSSGCATDVDAPFCGAEHAVELTVGTSARFTLR